MGNLVGIVDYGAGNILSMTNALDFLGCETILASSPDALDRVSHIVLPGVGSFIPAMKMLERTGFADALPREAEKKPLLGVCLGMQLLFDSGTENGEYPGLGLIRGKVRLIDAPGLLIPHMGWNELRVKRENPLIAADTGYVYFVHSYMAECERAENVLAVADYGEEVTAAVQGNGSVFGTQFHPEKSGDAGLEILRRFTRL